MNEEKTIKLTGNPSIDLFIIDHERTLIKLEENKRMMQKLEENYEQYKKVIDNKKHE